MSNAMSLNPETFLEGGGLVDDVDVVVKDAKFVMWDYNGKIPQPSPALCLTMEVEDEEVLQYYSMGSAKDWLPSEDGAQLLSVGTATAIRKTSNGGIFLTSLIDSGFPVEDLGDDISVLDELQAHMIRVPAPKRGGLKQEEKKYEQTILIVSEIIAMPGEKKKPTGAPKKKTAKGKAKPKPKSKKEEPEGDASEKATMVIMSILEEEGTITKKDLPGKLFQTLKSDPDRNAIIKLAFDDDFLDDGPWTYEDGTLIAA